MLPRLCLLLGEIFSEQSFSLHIFIYCLQNIIEDFKMRVEYISLAVIRLAPDIAICGF